MRSQYLKCYFLFLSILLCTLAAQAQDLIILNNAEEIPAKVEQIGIDDVTYKKYNNLEGPSYRIPKSTIFIIKYQNGIKEIFTNYTAPAITIQAPVIPTKLTFGSHQFRLNHKAVLTYDEAGELIKKSKNPEAYKFFKTAKTQQTLSKPARIVGLIVGITGTLIVFSLASDENSSSSSSSSSSSNNSSSENNGMAIAATSTVTISGWAAYAYSIILKRKASDGFRKSTDIYNAGF